MSELIVSGGVASRDEQPFVQISNEEGKLSQMSVAQARKFADDIVIQASRAEADAMFFKFFRKMEFPDGALAALLIEFRDFRHQLDMEIVEGSHSDPETGEKL